MKNELNIIDSIFNDLNFVSKRFEDQITIEKWTTYIIIGNRIPFDVSSLKTYLHTKRNNPLLEGELKNTLIISNKLINLFHSKILLLYPQRGRKLNNKTFRFNDRTVISTVHEIECYELTKSGRIVNHTLLDIDYLEYISQNFEMERYDNYDIVAKIIQIRDTILMFFESINDFSNIINNNANRDIIASESNNISTNNISDNQKAILTNEEDKVYFKVGLLFAKKEIYSKTKEVRNIKMTFYYHNDKEFSNTNQLAKHLGFSHQYINDSFKNSDSHHNIFKSKTKLENIITHCNEKNITIDDDFLKKYTSLIKEPS